MNLLFLDTETTDKLENGGCLVQLAFKLGNKKANWLFKPPVSISFEAMSVHHITNEMVKEKPIFETSQEKFELQELLKENILVAHNAKFDIAILEKEGIKTDKYIDTLKVAQNLFDLTQYKLQFLRYNFGLEIGQVRAHDAEGDIEVLEALFNYLFHAIGRLSPEASESKIIELMLKWTADPLLLKRINFGKHKGKEFKDLPKDYLVWLGGQNDLDEDLKYTIKHYLKA